MSETRCFFIQTLSLECFSKFQLGSRRHPRDDQGDPTFPQGVFICEDPPAHSAHRGVLSRVFTPKKMNGLEPQIREFCATLSTRWSAVAASTSCRSRYADADAGYRHVARDPRAGSAGGPGRAATTGSIGMPGQAADFTTNNLADDTFFGDYIEWRASHPSDDLMSELLVAEFTDETGTVRRLTREEILTFVTVLASAGNETTNRLIGWTGKVLADHPDQRRELVADRSLIPNAIEEVLRYEPPAHQFCRYVNPRRRLLRGDGSWLVLAGQWWGRGRPGDRSGSVRFRR